MARPKKDGLDYFPLDVNFLQDLKIRRILKAQPAAIGVLIALLCNVYRDKGYYIGFGDDECFLIADEVGVSEGAVQEVVNMALKVGFFDSEKYEQYRILTSKGIQSRYAEAVSRRKIKVFDDRYRLIDIVNECNNSVNVYNNSVNVCNNAQSKVKESKVKESKVKESKVKESKAKESKAKESKAKKTYSAPAGARGVLESFCGDDLQLYEAFNAYLAMRQANKFKMTEQAMKLAITELKKLTDDRNTMIAIIEQSTLKGWKSFYALPADKAYSRNNFNDVDNWARGVD